MVFFTTIGFIGLTLAMLGFTAGYAMVFFDSMGEYNIGGVPNSWKTKVVCLLGGCVILFFWYILITNAPFTIAIAAV